MKITHVPVTPWALLVGELSLHGVAVYWNGRITSTGLRQTKTSDKSQRLPGVHASAHEGHGNDRPVVTSSCCPNESDRHHSRIVEFTHSH
jgi:hypothetical protein